MTELRGRAILALNQVRALGARRPWRPRPRVLDLTRDMVRVERGCRLGRPAPKAAVLATWSPRPCLSRSVAALVHELHAADYRVVLVRAGDVGAEISGLERLPPEVTLIRRPNLGYDFGSWATALDLFPDLASARRLLLMNDSLAGPFASLAPLLSDLETSTAAVWGLTDSVQRGHHLQSYALGFSEGVMNRSELRAFWADIRLEPNKSEVVRRYELGLAKLLHKHTLSIEAAFPHSKVLVGRSNPVVFGWRRLLDLGFPFVKRELLTKPTITPDAADAPREILRRFEVRVEDWL